MTKSLHIMTLACACIIALSCSALSSERDMKALKEAIAEKDRYDMLKMQRINELHKINMTGGGRIGMGVCRQFTSHR